jgi:hypothetical protein
MLLPREYYDAHPAHTALTFQRRTFCLPRRSKAAEVRGSEVN